MPPHAQLAAQRAELAGTALQGPGRHEGGVGGGQAALEPVLALLAPQAWLDYPSVLAGVFSDPSEGAANLSLSQGLSSAGWESNALLAVRFSSIEVMRNAAEIVVYGTAAVVEEVQQEE